MYFTLPKSSYIFAPTRLVLHCVNAIDDAIDKMPHSINLKFYIQGAVLEHCYVFYYLKQHKFDQVSIEIQELFLHSKEQVTEGCKNAMHC